MRVSVAVTAILAAVIPLAACGGSSHPAGQTVRGQVMGGTQAGATVSAAYGGPEEICAGAVTGTQVVIKGPSGKLLATTTLHPDPAGTATLNLPGTLRNAGVGYYTFKATIPAGSGPYTVDLVGVASRIVSGRQLHHLWLYCANG